MIDVPVEPKGGRRTAYIGLSESQSAAIAAAPPIRRARPPLPVIKHRELHDAVGWFRDAWQDALTRVDRLHEGWSSVEPEDQNGGPAWHRRFARFVLVGPETYDPFRIAWARMRYTGGRAERAGAAFLFVLACRDFDLRTAGLAMAGHCVCPQTHLPECACADPARGKHQHGPCSSPSLPLFEEYVGWFAVGAIARLRDLLDHPPDPTPVDRPGWMERTGFSAQQRDLSSG